MFALFESFRSALGVDPGPWLSFSADLAGDHHRCHLRDCGRVSIVQGPFLHH